MIRHTNIPQGSLPERTAVDDKVRRAVWQKANQMREGMEPVQVPASIEDLRLEAITAITPEPE